MTGKEYCLYSSLFVYLFTLERQIYRDGETKSFHLLIHSPSGCNTGAELIWSELAKELATEPLHQVANTVLVLSNS